MKNLLIIAATDSSGGAGLTRDIAVATALGYNVKPVVAAVTAQTDKAFECKQLLSPEMISAQITAAFANTAPIAIKIGMLGSAEIVTAIINSLPCNTIPIVIDPVLKSSSGGKLFSGDMLSNENIDKLFQRATLLTPNLEEAAALTQTSKANTSEKIVTQAMQLLNKGSDAVLIKGGHGEGANCIDLLATPTEQHYFSTPRIPKKLRGTGCSLATAITCYLASGYPLKDACYFAKQNIQKWFQQS